MMLILYTLEAYSTLDQIKQHEKKSLKLYFVFMLLCQILFFSRIIDWDTFKKAWNKLKEEFEGSTRVKAIKLLTLKREFEMLKMKNSDSVKDYTTKLMSIVNQIRLAGEQFSD